MWVSVNSSGIWKKSVYKKVLTVKMNNSRRICKNPPAKPLFVFQGWLTFCRLLEPHQILVVSECTVQCTYSLLAEVYVQSATFFCSCWWNVNIVEFSSKVRKALILVNLFYDISMFFCSKKRYLKRQNR